VAAPVAPRQLTPKQAKFIAEYLVDLNGLQAAVRAGISPKQASLQAQRWIRNDNVWQHLQAELRLSLNETGITKSRTLQELALLAYSNIDHYTIDEAGNVQPTPEAPPGAMRAISSVKHKISRTTDEDGTTTVQHEVEFRLWNKNDALRDVMKHLKMLTDEPTPVHIDVTISLADRLTNALERAHAQRKQATLKVA
jgi:phage terminase small subunit